MYQIVHACCLTLVINRSVLDEIGPLWSHKPTVNSLCMLKQLATVNAAESFKIGLSYCMQPY